MECQVWVSFISFPSTLLLLSFNVQPRYIWFGSNAILFIFTWIFIPETRDRTLEEINEMFEAKLPARKFKGYNCVGTAAMAAVALKENEASVVEDEGTKSQAGVRQE
jgi:hypothetical protein